MAELKPCPFCGSEHVVLARNAESQWRVYCATCDGSFWIGNVYDKISVREAYLELVERSAKK